MKQNAVNVVIVGLELLDACSSLEAEDIDGIILPCQSERLLAWELTGHRYSTLTNKECLAASEGICLDVHFVHLYESVRRSNYKFERVWSFFARLVYEDNKCYFFFLHELLYSLWLVNAFELLKRIQKFLGKIWFHYCYWRSFALLFFF